MVSCKTRKKKGKTKGGISICLNVKAYNPDGSFIGEETKEYDLATKQFAQFAMALIFANTQTITDTGGTGRSIANNNATSAITVCAGTGSTSATVTDTNLGTQTETVTGTVNAYSGSGSSGSFTITGTITATADRAYAEVGIKITCATFTFLLCRDTFTTLNVSNTGTLAVTYTITFN